MSTTTIFPGRYVQGSTALSQLGDELARFGKKVLLLEDPFVAEHWGKTINEALAGKIASHVEVFCGECCDEEISRLSNLAQDIAIVAGVGGGKTIDTAKAVAHNLNVPVAVIPTLASSDAPCSALSVIYTQAGEFSRYLILPKNPDLVLVDTTVIANAPARFLVSGMGDALATRFEAESCHATKSTNMTGQLGSYTALGLARLCYETLLEYGVHAKAACEAKVPTEALERVVEANTLLSGVGFESAGLAAAHAIHNGLTVLEATHQYWHGEKVAIGTLASLVLTGKSPEIIDEVFSFCESVGLPTTLADIGLADVSDADLMAVAEATVAPGETIHNEAGNITANAVFSALKAADQIGRYRKNK